MHIHTHRYTFKNKSLKNNNNKKKDKGKRPAGNNKETEDYCGDKNEPGSHRQPSSIQKGQMQTVRTCKVIPCQNAASRAPRQRQLKHKVWPKCTSPGSPSLLAWTKKNNSLLEQKIILSTHAQTVLRQESLAYLIT